MGKIILSGADFLFSEEMNAHIDNEGNLVSTRQDNVHTNDVVGGFISKNTYYIKDNTSIIFEFSVSGSGAVDRNNLITLLDNGDIAYINKNKDLVIGDSIVISNISEINDTNTELISNGKEIVLTVNNKIVYKSDAELTNKLSEDNVYLSIDLGKDFIVYVDENSLTHYETIGDVNIDVDDCVNTKENYELEKVVAGDSFYIGLNFNNQVYVKTSTNDNCKVDSYNSFVVDIAASKDKYAVMTKDKVFIYQVVENKPKLIASEENKNGYKILMNQNAIIILKNNGESIIIDYQGNKISGNLIDGVVLDNNTIIGLTNKNELVNISDLKPIDRVVAKYSDMYPFLDKENSVCILFGTQAKDLPPTVAFKKDFRGNDTNIISKNNNSALEEICRYAKMVGISSDIDNNDLIFSSFGDNIARKYFIRDVYNPGKQLLDDKEGTYQMLVSYSSYGQHIKLKKEVNGEFIVLFEDLIFLKSRPTGDSYISIYVKNAPNLSIRKVTITDDVNVNQLPVELVYRDMDAFALQTKIAEMIDSQYQAIEKISSNVSKLTSGLTSGFEVLDKKIKELQ